MILPYDRRLKSNSRSLRSNMTDAEQKLWQRLRRKQINGWQFYRQKPLGNYIVDFYCAAAHLVVEIDGSQHYEPEQQQSDRERDEYLTGLGLRVLRFDNRQVLLETEAVVEVISKIPPAPLLQRGGVAPTVATFVPDFQTGVDFQSLTHPIPPSQAIPIPPFEKGGLGGIHTAHDDEAQS